MSDNQDMGKLDDSRRTVLKKMGAIGLGSALSPTVIGTATANTTEESTYVFHDEEFTESSISEQNEYYDATHDERYAVGNGLRSYGGQESNDGNWEVMLDLNGYGSVRRYPYDQDPEDGDPVDKIGRHRVSIFNDDIENAAITTSDHPEWIGGWPAEEYNEIDAARDLFEGLAEIALGEVSHMGPIMDAAELFEDVSHDYSDSQQDENRTYEFGWDYTGSYGDRSAHSDTDQYLKWEAHVDKGSNADHYVESHISTEGWGVQVEINWEITVYAPSDTDSMSTEEQEEIGLRLVEPTELRRLGFTVSEENLTEEGLVRYAPDIPIEAEVVSADVSPI